MAHNFPFFLNKICTHFNDILIFVSLFCEDIPGATFLGLELWTNLCGRALFQECYETHFDHGCDEEYAVDINQVFDGHLSA